MRPQPKVERAEMHAEPTEPGPASVASQRGISLVELSIAVVILVATLIPVVSICHQGARLRQLDAELSLAFQACSNNLEEVRSLPFAQVAAAHGRGFDVPGSNGAPGGLRARGGDADGLPGEIAVAVEETSGGQTLYRVTATVLWRGGSGEQELRLDTLIANKG